MLWVIFLGILLLAAVVVVVAVGLKRGSKGCRRRNKNGSGSSSSTSSSSSSSESLVYGEFVRPFTFDEENVALPIVQPGGSLIFPVPTVQPVGMSYIDATGGVGLLVPQGVYLVQWELNPSTGAAVNLLVNGNDPQTILTDTVSIQYNYAKAVSISPINFQYLVVAPLPVDNLLSLVNAGDSLFTLQSIPNTAIGATSLLTHIRAQRIAPLPPQT